MQVASTELDGFVPARTGTWKVQITICSADGLARKSMFKTPDPFCLATMSSGQQFCTQPARKTLSPQWNYSDRIVVTPVGLSGRRFVRNRVSSCPNEPS